MPNCPSNALRIIVCVVLDALIFERTPSVIVPSGKAADHVTSPPE